MLLVGNVDVENLTRDSGVLEPIIVSFVLPRDLRRDTQLRLKYFGYYSGRFDGLTSANVDTTGDLSLLLEPLTWRYVPQEIQMRVRGNGADLLSANTSVGFINQVTPGVSDTGTIDYIPFQRTMQLEAGQSDGVNAIGNTTAWEVPPVVSNGHNAVYDMVIGTVQKNVTQIDVELKVIRDTTRDLATYFSFEDKVRIDSISFQLEINE